MFYKLFNRLNLRNKAFFFIAALLLPFFIVLAASLAVLWIRTVAVLEMRLDNAESLVIRSIAAYKQKTTVYAGIIGDNYLVRQATYLNDVGTVHTQAAPIFSDLGVNHIEVYEKSGVLLFQKSLSAPEKSTVRKQIMESAVHGETVVSINRNSDTILLETCRPIYHTNIVDFVVGAACVGYRFDDNFATEINRISGVNIILAEDRYVIASSLKSEEIQILSAESIVVDSVDYDAVSIGFAGSGFDSIRLYIAENYSVIKDSFKRAITIILIAFLGFSTLGIMVAKGIATSVLTSAKLIIKHARSLSNKEFDDTIQLTSGDEFAEVAEAFNLMSFNLKDSFTKIENQAEELASTKTYLNNIIDSMPSLLIGTDQAGSIRLLNERASQYYAAKLQGPDRCHFIDLLDDFEPEVVEEIKQAIQSREQTCLKNLRVTKNPAVQYLTITVFPIVEGSRGESMIRIDDITEQYLMESQFRQAQKMESLGRLAGGIAHDFNNILSGIFGYSHLAKIHASKPEKLEQDIDRIVEAGQRASALIHQILTVSRPSELEKRAHRFDLIVIEAMKLLRSTIPANIEIQENIDSDATILADSTQIHQVIMNLCTNAYHAMADSGGLLTVNLLETRVEEDEQSLNLEAGSYLKLEIIDTGHGMDEETLEKAMEPYFTTKERGKGTGLGLPLVQSVIQNHQGRLIVDSSPGGGTTCQIYLPVESEGEVITDNPSSSPLVLEGNERVMLVDDEADIRITVQKILEEKGYSVTPFKNGKEALQAFSRAPDEFDLLVTDLMMPKMTGDDLAVEVLKIRNEFPIILCTGFSDKCSKAEALKIGVKKYMEKPIPGNRLLAAIRENLDLQA